MGEREKLIEVMARAMLADELKTSKPNRDFDETWEIESGIWLSNARAALSALEAAGVRIVPVEATTEMQNAAAPLLAEVNSIIVAHAVRTGSEGLKQPVTLAQIYAAMLSASPFSPPAKDAP